MTLLAGLIEVGPDGLRIENDSGGYLALKPGFAKGASALVKGRACLLGMRPEHVAIIAADSADRGSDTLPGKILSVETTGFDTHVMADTPLGRVTAIRRGRSDLRVGDRLALRPAPARWIALGKVAASNTQRPKVRPMRPSGENELLVVALTRGAACARPGFCSRGSAYVGAP